MSGCLRMYSIGSDNEVLLGNYISDDVVIGSRNHIGPMACIGSQGEHKRTYTEGYVKHGRVEIGDNNVIREFVTVQMPVNTDVTHIGSNCFIMTKAHIPHDAWLEDFVTMASLSIIGGNTLVMRGANIGLGACTHQSTIVGTCAMVGMGSIVTKDVPPFTKYYDMACRGVNDVGMLRLGFAQSDIDEVRMLYENGIIPKSESVVSEFNRFAEFNKVHGRKVAPYVLPQ